jgi:hemin uptake protein HemP
MAAFFPDGAVELYHNNSKKFETTSAGVTVTGQATVSNGLEIAGTARFANSTRFVANATFDDNSKAIFGEDSDLQIYHDGSDSYISDTGTGDLILKGSGNVKIQSADGENHFMGVANGNSFIYHNNNIKLQTTSVGVVVTGKIQATSIHRQPHFISFMIQGNPFSDIPGSNFKLLPISSSGGSAANNFSSPNTDAYIVAPYGGRIKSLIIRNVRNTPTSGPTRIRVYKNGATSSTTSYVTPTGTGSGMYARWTFSDTFSQYDRIQMAFESSSSTTDWKDCTAVLEMQYDNYSY